MKDKTKKIKIPIRHSFAHQASGQGHSGENKETIAAHRAQYFLDLGDDLSNFINQLNKEPRPLGAMSCGFCGRVQAVETPVSEPSSLETTDSPALHVQQPNGREAILLLGKAVQTGHPTVSLSDLKVGDGVTILTPANQAVTEIKPDIFKIKDYLIVPILPRSVLQSEWNRDAGPLVRGVKDQINSIKAGRGIPFKIDD